MVNRIRAAFAALFGTSAQDQILAQQAATLQKFADALLVQQRTMQQYLGLFEVKEMQPARTLRDQDEYRLELERKGFPVKGTPEEQSKWVLEQTRY